MGLALMSTGAYVVKSSDLAAITNALNANAAVIVPWGMGILAIFMGIKFIPRLIKSFGGRG